MLTLEQLREKAKKKFHDESLTILHLLITWASEDETGELKDLLQKSGLEIQTMVTSLNRLLEGASEEDRKLLVRTIRSVSGEIVKAHHMMQTICSVRDNRIVRELVGAGMDCDKVMENIQNKKREQTLLNTMGIKIDPHKAPLLQFGRDLIELAEQGAFAELCPRPDIINRMLDILLRKRKANPILTGPAGVGKTALVELLALDIAQNPRSHLSHYHLFEISLGKVVAGTKYRGEFEARFEDIMQAVIKLSPSILFIDEIHLLWGAGRAERAPMDGANLIKPYIARDAVRVIGATTSDEYNSYILRDEALARRFQEIKIQEPDSETTWQMVHQQVRVLEKHHGLSIHENIILKAIEMTDKHLVNRYQPDKTIDLMDTAAVAVRRDGKTTIEADDLLNTLAQMLDVPIGILTGKDKDLLRNLEKTLKSRIIGQDEAVQRVASKLVHRRMDIARNDERPLGVFLFLGDTGVGKTELGRNLAAAFFGHSNKLIHIDLGEYTNSTSVHKLVGAPSGYKGSEDDGLLIKGLQKHASCVILLDEIEKADPEVHRLLLGLLDNGRITSARGRQFDARQCIIIMTTNAVTSSDLKKSSFGFGQNETEKGDIENQLKTIFPSEFLGRIDEIIPFNALSDSNFRAIMELRLNEIQIKLLDKGIILDYEKERLLDHLVGYMDKKRDGARGIQKIIEKHLLQPLSMAMLHSDKKNEMTIKLDQQFYVESLIQLP